MVALFDHCTFNLNPRATSIDTPLHAFVPARHVDHVHADAVIAIAASSNAEKLTKEIYGDEIGFLPWQRPGFDLGLKLGEMATNHPEYVGVVLGGHGLFTWGPTSKSCYETTLRIIQKAADWLAAHEREPAFFGARHSPAVAGGAPRSRGPAAARDSGKDILARAQGRAFLGCARSAGIRQFERPRRSRAARHVLPRPFPADENPSARAALRSRRQQSRRGARRLSPSSSRIIATSTPPITSAASVRIRPRCATPTR